jgi:hypothetical protein
LWRQYGQFGTLRPLLGATEAIYCGRISGFDHLHYINGNGGRFLGLPYDCKLLMVGDAKVYYIGRRCDYWVTFSNSPFVEAIASASGKAGPVLDWLRQQGYTHIWADFSEIQRLGRTYGFAPSVDARLFERLEAAGLRRLHEVRLAADGQPYGILYEVPHP